MVNTHTRPNRKISTGIYKAGRKKKHHEMGRDPTLTKISEKRTTPIKKRAGVTKDVLLAIDIANVLDPKTKKYEKLKIKTILENPANRHYVRRNIITKGSVIETEKGKARVTSRPGQEASVSAVLI